MRRTIPCRGIIQRTIAVLRYSISYSLIVLAMSADPVLAGDSKPKPLLISQENEAAFASAFYYAIQFSANQYKDEYPGRCVWVDVEDAPEGFRVPISIAVNRLLLEQRGSLLDGVRKCAGLSPSARIKIGAEVLSAGSSCGEDCISIFRDRNIQRTTAQSIWGHFATIMNIQTLFLVQYYFMELKENELSSVSALKMAIRRYAE